MSHLHLVDGVVPIAWWVIGYILTLAVLGFSLSRIKKETVAKKVPYIGVVAALMLLTMSVPLGFLPFHLNLTVLAGILAGPWLGFTAVFIVNLILAFIGHGGITTMGLNTLIIGAEVITGYYLFSYLRRYVKPVAAVAFTVIVTLLLSTSLMIGLVTSTEVGLVSALPQSHEDHKEKNADLHAEELHEVLSEINFFKTSGWSAVALILLFGIAIEALITSLVVVYFLKIRPDLIIPVVTEGNDVAQAPTA